MGFIIFISRSYILVFNLIFFLPFKLVFIVGLMLQGGFEDLHWSISKCYIFLLNGLNFYYIKLKNLKINNFNYVYFVSSIENIKNLIFYIKQWKHLIF